MLSPNQPFISGKASVAMLRRCRIISAAPAFGAVCWSVAVIRNHLSSAAIALIPALMPSADAFIHSCRSLPLLARSLAGERIRLEVGLKDAEARQKAERLAADHGGISIPGAILADLKAEFGPDRVSFEALLVSD